MKNKPFVVVLCLLALPLGALAQSYLLQGTPPEKGRITLRYFWPQKGSYGGIGPDFLSGLYDLAARFRVSDRVQVMAALPFMVYKATYTNWAQERVSKSFSGLGNISVALELLLEKRSGRHTGLTVGAFLPTLAHKPSDDWQTGCGRGSSTPCSSTRITGKRAAGPWASGCSTSWNERAHGLEIIQRRRRL